VPTPSAHAPDQRLERGIVAGVHELVEQLCIGLIADMRARMDRKKL